MNISYENRSAVCGVVGAAAFVMSVVCVIVMMAGAAFAAPVFSVLFVLLSGVLLLPMLLGLLLLSLPRRTARRSR